MYVTMTVVLFLNILLPDLRDPFIFHHSDRGANFCCPLTERRDMAFSYPIFFKANSDRVGDAPDGQELQRKRSQTPFDSKETGSVYKS